MIAISHHGRLLLYIYYRLYCRQTGRDQSAWRISVPLTDLSRWIAMMRLCLVNYTQIYLTG